jgi:hypothetical protein
MPEIDGLPYKVFMNFLPLQLVWFVMYALVYIVIATLVAISFNTPFIYATTPIALVFLALLPFTSFILVAYAKNFDKRGLFSPKKPFEFMKAPITKKLYKLIAQFAPIWLFVTAFTVVTYYFNIPVKTQSNVTMVEEYFYQKLFVVNAVSAYMEIVMTFLWSYCVSRVWMDTVES